MASGINHSLVVVVVFVVVVVVVAAAAAAGDADGATDCAVTAIFLFV